VRREQIKLVSVWVGEVRLTPWRQDPKFHHCIGKVRLGFDKLGCMRVTNVGLCGRVRLAYVRLLSVG
jgi:hypothetical protein